MGLDLSDEQRELAGTVDRLLADRTAGPRARALLERTDGWKELWREIAELGVLAMGAPEEAGGLGLGPVELVAVAEAIGRHLAPGPLVATAGAYVPVLASLAAQPVARDALHAVAHDGAAGAVAYADPLTPGATPRVRGGRLDAELLVADVLALDRVALVAVDEDRDGAAAIVVLSPSEAELDAAVSIDETRPLTRLRARGLDVSDRVLAAPAGALGVAFATAAAELVGLADALVRMSVDYAGERQQFGAAIGSFQALKHRLVDAHLAVERARSHVYHAAVRAAADPGTPETATAVHFAKAAAGDAATTAARAAVQVHGGIGITREHDVSLLYLRARQASMMLGGADAHYLAAIAAEGAHAG